MNSFSLFKRYIFSRRAESIIRTLGWLVITATFFGVSCLVVVLNIMNGFNKDFKEQLLSTTPHLKVAGDPALMTSLISPYSHQIQTIEAYSHQDVIVRSVDGKFSGAVARGQTLLEINEMLSRIRRSQKSLKPHEFLDLRAQEVVLTDSLARSLRAYPGEDLLIMPPESLTLPPGEAPIVERVRVRATVGVDVGEYANAGIFFEDGVTLQRLKKSRSREEGIEVRFFNPVMAEDVKSYLLRKEKLENKKVTTWVEANKAMFFALKMEKVAMGSLLSLAVLVTSFGIILLVTLLIIEKQKDIGLFQALGLSFNDTKKLFARLGLWLSSVGLFGGFFFGILVSIILKAVPLPDFPEIYTVRDLPVEFDLKQLGFLAIGLSALTVMAAYLPVRRAMQLTPAEALKGNVRDLKKLDV